jgi:4-amino-4-deoxy-L-arabinose transferase-like glycosyltransferase
MERRLRIAFWVLMGSAALLLLARTGTYPLTDPDESRFARTSVEMLREGELILPRFEGEPRLVKPPLLHWIQMPLFATFGISGWTARIHAVLATLASVFLVGVITRRRFGEEGALWASAVMATTPLVVLLGRIGNLDALLAVHVLAVVGLDLSRPRDPVRGRYWVAGALLGLAFLVKGPVGVVLPALVVLAGRAATGRRLFPSGTSLFSIVGGWSLVVLPWGLAFLNRVGTEAALRLVREEVLERYVSGTSHIEPPWFYLAVLLAGFFPWQASLALGLVRVIRSRRRREVSTALYAAAGLGAGFTFFSLSAGKLPNYILPLAPLVAIVVAWELGQEFRDPRRELLGPCLLCGSLGCCALAFGITGWWVLDGEPRRALLAGAAIYGTGLPIALSGLLARRPRRVAAATAIASALVLMFGLWILTPAIVQTRTTAYLVQTLPELRSSRPLVLVALRLPSLTLYLDRVPERIALDQIEERMGRADAPLFVFARCDFRDLPQKTSERLREVGGHGKLLVLEEKPAARGP